MKCYMEVNYYLRAYKEAFTTEVAMNVLGTMLADLCQKVCVCVYVWLPWFFGSLGVGGA